MEELMWNDVVVLFREYMGTGLIVVWYLLSLIYLFVKEKRKPFRVLFLYVPVILLLLYFNPLFAQIVYGVAGSEIYYRILWLLPFTVVIAYTCVQIYGELRGFKKGLWAMTAAMLLMVSGKFIYDNPYFHEAENLYHVPGSVVNICDAIEVPGREVMAVFPIELVQYVRQYSPVVCMPYGREIMVERWNNFNELYDAMEAEKADLAWLAPLAKEASCHYIILRKDKEVIGQVEDYDWVYFGETQDYIIYRDIDIPLEIPGLSVQK